MAELSLSTAWNETASFVKREAALLFPIGFLLVALPLAILTAVTPAAPRGQMPEAGAWLGIAPLAFILGFIGNIAISYLALRPGTSVGEALARGARRFLPLLGATLIFILGLCAVLFVLAIVVAGFMGGVRPGTPDPAAVAGPAALLLALVLLPLILFLATRFLLVTPVAAAEEGGPIAILRRSWALTRGRFWALLGFLLLLGILVGVVSLAATAVSGSLIALLSGSLRPGSVGGILMLLVATVLNTLFSVFMTTIVARLYAQLADEPTSGI
jgi:hypothetical protein